MTGSLDEVQIREIEEENHALNMILQRKQEVLRLIQEQEKLTPEIEESIKKAEKIQEIEDIYRPFKQKRRTKATIAKEQGLEPLAKQLLALPTQLEITVAAQQYINEEKNVTTVEEALQGAHEIMCEEISEQPHFRKWIRQQTWKTGILTSALKAGAEDEKSVYGMYYAFSEPVKQLAPHRILALNRGEKEAILKVAIDVDEQPIFAYLEQHLIGKKNQSPAVANVRSAYQAAYKRFIAPAIDREIRNELTAKGDEQAIHVFGENLHHLLLQPPLKGRIVMGFDPAYRTGCKLAIVDATGKLMAIQVIYPHKPASASKRAAAGQELRDLIEQYHVETIAIGNGTASRESELFVAEQIAQLARPIYYVIVSEAGASVYSASPVARAEFPELQVEQRSAISIARRLQDPLAELVKIDPQSVGVGQYQHDLPEKSLSQRLDFVVETAVNQVGVNVNTASQQLLQHISGLNKTTAKNIVSYRDENGSFSNRTQLKKVPRLGPKAYEQAIGFLRIPDGQLIFDNTSIHPESYAAARQLLDLLGLSLTEIGSTTAAEKLKKINIKETAGQLDLGTETLADIVKALLQPGRDLRDELPAPLLRQDVLAIEDLRPGMQLQGTVRNVVDFGAFVDIGVKQDGLVHISKLSTKYVKHPSDIVAVGDIVTVWVDSIDTVKQRIALSMLPL